MNYLHATDIFHAWMACMLSTAQSASLTYVRECGMLQQPVDDACARL